MPAAGQRTARKPRKVEKSEITQQAIFDSAVKVVGAIGYDEASVARITERAGIAQGTFYYHYESRQHLFDQLLPRLGDELIRRVRTARIGGKTFLDREERGFRAFFDYLIEMPEFHRILSEAEVFSPTGYRNHIRNMIDGYVRSLKRAVAAGEIIPLNDRELEVAADLLLAARHYLAMRFVHWGERGHRLPDWVVRAYMRLITGGLGSSTPLPAPCPPEHSPAPPPASVEARDFELYEAAAGRAVLRLPAASRGRDDALPEEAIQALVLAVARAAVTGGGATPAPDGPLSLSSLILDPRAAGPLTARAEVDTRIEGRLTVIAVEIITEEARPVARATVTWHHAAPRET